MPGVTTAGFVPKYEAEIFAEVIADCRATVDSEFDDSPDSAGGQIVGIVSSKHAEAYEVLQAVWGALSENASGANLDRLAALTGSKRLVDESDAAFRVRRRIELSDQGATTQGAMRAALSKLAGMQAVRVISNRTMLTDANGRPPKSVEAIVLGTTTVPLLTQTIWDNLAAGIETHGTTTSAITDSEGHTQVIKYSVAAPVSWYVRISAEVDEGSFAGVDVVKQRIVDFTKGALTLAMQDGSAIAGGVDIEGVLYRSRISAAALTVAGVVAVTQVQFKKLVGDAWTDTDRPLDARTFLGVGTTRGFELDHIEVVPT